jgi:hypothetical protein
MPVVECGYVPLFADVLSIYSCSLLFFRLKRIPNPFFYIFVSYLKFYKILAVPVLLYGSETWALRKRDWNRIQAAEMKYL